MHYCCGPQVPGCEEARVAVARALITRWGADIWGVAGANNETALQVAAAFHNTPLVDFFITECNMPVNMGEEYSGTHLMNACRKNSSDALRTVKLLVEKLGADPTLRDGGGLTSADIASKPGGMPEVHEYLTRAACIYKAKPTTPGVERVTIVAAVADTETGCREAVCFAHSTCVGHQPDRVSGLACGRHSLAECHSLLSRSSRIATDEFAWARFGLGTPCRQEEGYPFASRY